jgi:hypothetical protein
MALFGHSSAILISTDDVSESVESWSALGFSSLDVPPQNLIESMMTDGQVFVAFTRHQCDSPALLRYTASIDRVLQRSRDKEIAIDASNRSSITIPGPGGLFVRLHHREMQQRLQPDRTQNPVLGHFDVLLVRVSDIDAARLWAERAGFIVEMEHRGYPQRVDMTDGLSRVGFLASHNEGRELTYITSLDEDFVRDIDEIFSKHVEIYQSHSGTPSMVRIQMPEGTWITIVSDDDE